MTWSELREAHLAELHRQGLTLKTRELAGRWLAAFLGFCQGQGVTSPEQLTAAHLPAFYQHLLWTPHSKGRLYSANSLDQMRRMVRTFLRWAHAQHHLAQDLTVGLAWARPLQPAQRTLTPEDVERLLRSVPDNTPSGLRNRALLQLFYRGRLTREQALGLDLADVSLRTRQLQLRQGSPRVVLLGEELAHALSRYLWDGRPQLGPQPGERALLLNRKGGRLQPAHLLILVAELGFRAGLERVSPRLLARSCPDAPGGLQDLEPSPPNHS